jgi:hypothetical protein
MVCCVGRVVYLRSKKILAAERKQAAYEAERAAQLAREEAEYEEQKQREAQEAAAKAGVAAQTVRVPVGSLPFFLPL